MSKLKLIKKIFMEAFQWTAFATPIFVTGQRLATKECTAEKECASGDNTEYWLLIAGIIAYVTGITLILWLPVKIFIVWKKVFRPYEDVWFPGNLLYVLFSALPCVIFVLIAHGSCGSYYPESSTCFDYFRGAPVETFVIMMVVTDWSEKFRYIRLRSSDDRMKKSKYTSANDWNNRTKRDDASATGVGDPHASSRRSSISHSTLLHPSVRNRNRFAKYLKWTDARPENLLRDLMLVYDVRLLLDISQVKFESSLDPDVFETNWLYPIYIFAVIGFLPLVFTPNSDLRSSFTVILQDIPFFILRVSLFGYFGSELVLNSSVLFLLKNFFVALAFIYFNIVLPMRNAKKERHEYKLEMLGEDRDTHQQDSRRTGSQREIETYFGVEAHDREQYPLPGISNPAYTSRRDRMRTASTVQRQYSTRSETRPNEDGHGTQYQYVTGAQYADDESVQYASPPTAYYHEPQTVRVENSHPVVQEAYYVEAAIPENQQEFADDDSEPEQTQPSPIQQPRQTKPVQMIDYDTLHNPKSFLYNQESNRRPEVHEINFEDPSLPQTTELPPKRQSTKRESIKQTTVATPPNNSPKPESPYSEVDYTRKSRRKAPPPPTKPGVRNTSKPSSFPPPPPDMLNNENKTIPNGKISRSPSKKQAESNEMSAELAHKLAMEAISAVEEAANYGSKIGGDWSGSTTPKSTYSMQRSAMSTAKPNEQEYDIRL